MEGELKQISNLALFAKVVQSGGISSCAASMGMERTTVSRRLAALERELGVVLLRRSPRAVTVTKAGRLCYDQCEGILELARSAELAATNGQVNTNAEPILVSAPTDIIEHFVADALAAFDGAGRNTKLRCDPVGHDVTTLDPKTDLLVGWERLSQKNYYVTSVGDFQQAIYASPDYIARNGEPDRPADLRKHTRIGIATNKRAAPWLLETNGKTRRITTRPEIEVGNMLEAVSSAVAGLGIALLPTYLCDRDVKDGRLRPVLREFETPARQMYLTARELAHNRTQSTAFRLFLEKWFRDAAARLGVYTLEAVE